MKKILVCGLVVLFLPLFLILGGAMASDSGSSNNSASYGVDGGITIGANYELYEGLYLPPAGTLEPPCESFNGGYYGQCTSWACYRSNQLGHPIEQPAGNGKDVAQNLISRGWLRSSTPQKEAVVSFWDGGGSHVAIVEEVLPDGTWITSDMNVNGNRQQVFKATYSDPCKNCIFAVWKESK